MTSTYFVQKLLLVAFTVVILLLSIGIVAHAATAEVDAQNATQDDTEQCLERINQDLAICETDVEDGHAVVVLELDRPKRITLTEVSDSDGHLSRETYSISQGKSELRLPLSQGSSNVGVTIDDGRDLYLKMIETDSQLIGPPWGPTDAQLAAIGAALSVSFVVIFLVWRVLRGHAYNPARIA